jgi:hypothetical protein
MAKILTGAGNMKRKGGLIRNLEPFIPVAHIVHLSSFQISFLSVISKNKSKGRTLVLQIIVQLYLLTLSTLIDKAFQPTGFHSPLFIEAPRASRNPKGI